MKLEDMYVGQEVRVRSWEDMMSDPDLFSVDTSSGTAILSKNGRGVFEGDKTRYCGKIVTVRSLTLLINGIQTEHIRIEERGKLRFAAWASWMFEPIESKVDSDVLFELFNAIRRYKDEFIEEY